jgi:hypothetical protein
MADKKLDIIGGGKKWLYTLLGKTPPAEADSTAGVETVQETQEGVGFQEDSVAGDIKVFKDLVKKGVDGTKTILSPFAKKGVDSTVATTKAVAGSVDGKFIKIAVRSFVAILLAIILIIIASRLFKEFREEKPVSQNGGAPVTRVPYEPHKPSVYEQDPEILILEEEIGILERELYGVNIKEDGIKPPQLDWNISF